MVVLTIVTQKNGETIFFDELIPQVHFMKLISCSLYNSWNTLKKEGSAVLGDEKRDPSVSVGITICKAWQKKLKQFLNHTIIFYAQKSVIWAS